MRKAFHGTECYALDDGTRSLRHGAGLHGQGVPSIRQESPDTDTDLWKAAQRANEGLVDADLGGGVIKQRIARAGEGKSGGSRVIVLLKKQDRAVYVYGFEKKDAANIDRRELEAFRELAAVILGYTDVEIEQRVNDGALFNVEGPGENHA